MERVAAAEAKLDPPPPVEIRVERFVDREDCKLLLRFSSVIAENEAAGRPILASFDEDEVVELDRLLEALPRDPNSVLRFEPDVVEELASDIEAELGYRPEIDHETEG